MSLPSWERGLKYLFADSVLWPGVVAPLVGAWIEILYASYGGTLALVAPLVGAWIEIVCGRYLSGTSGVAPLVGAWIEIWPDHPI